MAYSNKPSVACELTPERVIAARAAAGGSVDTVFARTLPPGSLAPALATPNVINASALREAISDALAAVGSRSKDVIVVVPDAAVRIVLLDFEELPERRQDADPVVRFRLKKSLPFEAEEAALSYDVRRSSASTPRLTSAADGSQNGAIKVIAAVAPAAVRAEYETLFRDTGYTPGVLLPSMLASLGAVEADAPTLALKVDRNSTSVAIVQGNDLLLYRTLENAHAGRIDAAALADDIYSSLVFFQDNYGMKVERILLGGLASAEEIGGALESQTGAQVSDLVSASQVGGQTTLAPSLMAGVVGALLG
jgi:type IV pilus assembly protein PilM